MAEREFIFNFDNWPRFEENEQVDKEAEIQEYLWSGLDRDYTRALPKEKKHLSIIMKTSLTLIHDNISPRNVKDDKVPCMSGILLYYLDTKNVAPRPGYHEP